MPGFEPAGTPESENKMSKLLQTLPSTATFVCQVEIVLYIYVLYL
jgi:hypothetical protein